MTNPNALHFGIKTTQYFPYEDILRVWQEADTVPAIEHAWLFDHPMPIGRADPAGTCLDGWTLLAALAGQTKRLRMGLMVAANTNQTPPQLAKRAATLDVISGGRLEFGIGAGGAGGLERERLAYGTDTIAPAVLVGRLSESCEIIRRMWTEPVVNFAGQHYTFTEIYCNPKPVQRPTPPFVLGGAGEQLTLRVVARQADVWNYAGLPIAGGLMLEEFERKSRVLDGYCTEIGRDPATLARSVQLIFDPADAANTRQLLLSLIAAGATHLVLAPRSMEPGIAHWLAQEVIEPVRAAAAELP